MSEMMHLVQQAVVQQQLYNVKEVVQKKTQEAVSLACTADTVQEVKKVRSKLAKEFQAAEERRKALKAEIMRPYDELEAVYAECIAQPYRDADAALKTKIAEVEGQLKSDCERRLREYFSELTAVEGVQWLTFEQSGITVDLTTAKQKTPKKAMERLKEFVQCVRQDVDAISNMENADEIADEYRQSLSLSAAVSAVNARHDRMDRIRHEEATRAAQMAAEAERVQRVEVAAPEAIAPPAAAETAEEMFSVSFTVTGTRMQLSKLKNFLVQEAIHYEAE